MAAGTGVENTNKTGDTLTFLAMFAFLFLLIGILAYLIRDDLTYIWRIYRYYCFTASQYIPFIGPPASELQEVLEFLRTTPSSLITFDTMWKIDQHYGRSFGIVVAALFLVIAYRRSLLGKGASGKLDGEEIIDYMSAVFPHLNQTKGFDPAKDDIFYHHGKDNSRAASVGVFEFATMSPPIGLTKYFESKDDERAIYLPDAEDWFVAFDKGLARKAFEAQMGSPLTTVNDMSDAEKKIYKHIKGMLLNNFSKKEVNALVQTLRAQHGFVRTFLMAMFQHAKKYGIYTVTDSIWLKKEDRILYYCLQSVNKDTPFAEAGGPFVHKDLEDMIGVRINTPEVTEAVEALDRYMQFDRETQKASNVKDKNSTSMSEG